MAALRRPRFFAVPSCAALLILWVLAPSYSAARPKVDVEAMREAMDASGDEEFASSASYAHFLRARLMHHAGNHRAAVDELRLALATDEYNAFVVTRLAEELTRLGDLPRAERELRRVLERTPNHYAAQVMMGRVLLEAGRTSRAKLHLRKAIKLKPQEHNAYFVLTQLYLEAKAYDDAIRVVEELSHAQPGESEGFRRLGLAFSERGESALAIKMLEKASERDPGDFDVWVSLARLYENVKRLREAERAYGRALERDPDNQDVLLAAGRVTLELGSLPHARAYFDRLLSLSQEPELAVRVAFSLLSARQLVDAAEVLDTARSGPSPEPRLSYYAGLVRERLHQLDAAAAAFAQVPEESELFQDARSHRASCLSRAGDHPRALGLLRDAMVAKPGDSTLVASYARALERSGAFEEAEAALQSALRKQAHPELFEALAASYQRQRQPDKAVSLLSQALQTRPHDELLSYLLATAYDRNGDPGRSIAQMREVLKANPENAGALNFVGYLLAQQGKDFDEAERLVKRALELRPQTGEFLDSLGWIQYRRGNYRGAVELLERAAALSNDEPVILEHLGDAYRQISKMAEAERAYRRAMDTLSLNPEAAEPAEQRLILQRKLKMLSTGAAGR